MDHLQPLSFRMAVKLFQKSETLSTYALGNQHDSKK